MKQLIFLLALSFVGVSAGAIDVGIKIINQNAKAVTVYAGVISPKINYLSDEEVIQQRESLGVISVGRKINAGKNISISQKELPKKKIFVLFGILDGGGRTEVFRFNTSTMSEKMTITFEKPEIFTPQLSYINIAKVLAQSNDLGAYQSLGDIRIVGYFLLYNITTEDKAQVYLVTPTISTEFLSTEPQTTMVSDVISKNATFPYISRKGELVIAVPENPTETYREAIIPPHGKLADFFGDKPYMFLTWRMANTRVITAKPASTNTIELFNSCNDFEKRQITDVFLRDFYNNFNPDFHLYYIKSVSRTDSVILYENKMEQLVETDEIMDGDIVASNGNFRPDGSQSILYSSINIVRNISAVDLTPLLVYKIVAEGTFKNTMVDAGNMLELYKYLSTYIQTPDLDEEALSVNKPSYTISKIRENIKKPDFYSALETKLNTEESGPIPPTILESLIRKLEKKTQ